jgi:hypothetical protein
MYGTEGTDVFLKTMYGCGTLNYLKKYEVDNVTTITDDVVKVLESAGTGSVSA